MFRMSLEPSSGGFNNHNGKITTTSIRALTVVSKSPLGAFNPENLRGNAINGIEWYCLACVEHLWARGDEDDNSTVRSSTLTAVLACISEHIFPERRTRSLDGAEYKLASPEAYAVEKWKAAIGFLNFLTVDDKVVDMIQLCEESHSLSKWRTDAYPGRENRLLYTSEALRDARGELKIGELTVRVEVARRHVKGRALSSVLKLVEERMVVAAAKVTKGAGTADEPNTAKAVADKEGAPLRKKRRLRHWPFGPDNGEEPSQASRSWRSTWSDDRVVAHIETKPTEACHKPPFQPTQAPRQSQRGWGPGGIENMWELGVWGEGVDEPESGYDISTDAGILRWAKGARVAWRTRHPCRFNVELDQWE